MQIVQSFIGLPSGRSDLSLPECVVSRIMKITAGTRTERHFNFIGYALNAHQGECNDGYNGYHAPVQISDESKRERKEVQRHALFQVYTIWKWVRMGSRANETKRNEHDTGIGVFATLSMLVSWVTMPCNLGLIRTKLYGCINACHVQTVQRIGTCSWEVSRRFEAAENFESHLLDQSSQETHRVWTWKVSSRVHARRFRY